MKRRTFMSACLASAGFPLIAQADILTPEDSYSALARFAYVYLYPMVENYLSLYQYAIDENSSDYKGEINRVNSVARVFTPEDAGVVTPNSDTPYSFLVMDLRAEPLVVRLPSIEDDRYYSVQIIDLYSHNVAYIGTRENGNEGGVFLIAGPGWSGEIPEEVDRVIRIDTEIAFALYRTQLFEPSDIERVKEIQDGYTVETLSKFSGESNSPDISEINWPSISRDEIPERFWEYANFLLQFAPPLAWEADLRESFTMLGVEPASMWPASEIGEEGEASVRNAGQDAHAMIARSLQAITDTADLFGTPKAMQGKYLQRAMGAMGGLYGNTAIEALYPSYQMDAEGQPFDASKNRYTVRMKKGDLPPVDAFWSLTMYDANSRLLVPNPLDRYLINSAMLDQLKAEQNGDIVLYLQKDSPGPERESNWLPAPDGPFAAVLRLYLPKEEALSGRWRPPAIEIAK
ncbi:DUF1254 domain-containing protein [Nitratireductor aquimarinus]|uniref:DUF1254 domain-containing protein n=1 Tax=Nitratireductor aquimarinus TaxID=889300 RepID=A0ABU4AF35_9HYPH|nr:DUF1254 domain-containing protein [Nitratireductor aquimarinus]MDV6224851.1 DUF1254 domain-containing protein [Nitratireductor aquimarinus]